MQNSAYVGGAPRKTSCLTRLKISGNGSDVFAGSVGPAFGVVGGLQDQPREQQCAAFHAKAAEGLKGLFYT